MKSFNKIFLTGCDKNTQWMLPWFMVNFLTYNKTPIIFADFGVTIDHEELLSLGFDDVLNLRTFDVKGWFKKPKSMIKASHIANKVCWLDTDIEILSDMSDIFNYTEYNKIGMVEDKPWTKRSGEVWHNSGVVAFENCPTILNEWSNFINQRPQRGDQETLHAMLNTPLSKMIHITDLPNEYNWLRIQTVDGEDIKNKKAIHWTGNKGKEHIRSLMIDG